jgi:transcriptional regulator with XRE-family HTH domain
MHNINEKDPNDEMIGIAFGLVLRRLRQKAGLSQEVLAFESGYHRTYISLLERGKKSPSLQTISNLAKILKIELSDFMKNIEVEAKSLSRNAKNVLE